MWSLLCALTLWKTFDLVLWDFRESPLSGDQANFMFQAQSLAHSGHNLSFDRADFERWEALGWADQPYGLFLRRYEVGWIFAKPVSYSGYLVPFIWLFGEVRGVALANAALLVALVVVVALLARCRFTGWTVPLISMAFVFASSTYFYAWVLHTELFLAVLTALATLFAVRSVRSSHPRDLYMCAAIVGWLFAEKATMAFAFLPIVTVLALRTPKVRERSIATAIGLGTMAISMAPYLWYSGGEHWNPYQGDRFRVQTTAPFAGGSSELSESLQTAERGDFFSLDILERFSRAPGAIPRSLLTTSIGRHTGLLPFAPLAFLVLAWAFVRGKRLGVASAACAAGIVLYLVLYATLLPMAYTGGQSLGNRYFVQVSPLVLGALVLATPTERVGRWIGSSAVVISLVLIGPIHLHPRTAYTQHLGDTTPLQRLLPPETQLRTWRLFACPYPHQEECLTRLAPKPEASGVAPVLAASALVPRHEQD